VTDENQKAEILKNNMLRLIGDIPEHVSSEQKKTLATRLFGKDAIVRESAMPELDGKPKQRQESIVHGNDALMIKIHDQLEKGSHLVTKDFQSFMRFLVVNEDAELKFLLTSDEAKIQDDPKLLKKHLDSLSKRINNTTADWKTIQEFLKSNSVTIVPHVDGVRILLIYKNSIENTTMKELLERAKNEKDKDMI